MNLHKNLVMGVEEGICCLGPGCPKAGRLAVNHLEGRGAEGSVDGGIVTILCPCTRPIICDTTQIHGINFVNNFGLIHGNNFVNNFGLAVRLWMERRAEAYSDAPHLNEVMPV